MRSWGPAAECELIYVQALREKTNEPLDLPAVANFLIEEQAGTCVKATALEEVIDFPGSGRFRTPHLATHRFIDDRVPDCPTRPGKDAKGDDGFLRLNEIFLLK